MSSVVQICNIALSQIRKTSINSLDDATLEAQNCTLLYPEARDQVLTDFNWGFNNSTKALQLLESKVFGWAYAWQYPSDCMRVHRLMREDEDIEPDTTAARMYDRRLSILPITNGPEYAIKYHEGAKVIVTNEADLYINYGAKVTDVTVYPAEMRMAISYRLAADLAIPLVGVKDGRVLRADAMAMYNMVKSEAEALAANQQQSPQQESEFITVRG